MEDILVALVIASLAVLMFIAFAEEADKRDWPGLSAFIIAAGLSAVATFVLLVGLAVYSIESHGCHRQGAQLGYDTRYDGWASTCFAQVGDRWVQVDQIRDILDD